MGTVLDQSNKVPGAYIQVSLGVGIASGASINSKVLLYGNKTSSGTATVGVPTQVASIDDARDKFGPGSELFLLAKRALGANPLCQLYAIPVTESAGAAAANTIVFGSGPSTKASSYRLTVAGETIWVPITSGMASTALATAVGAAINAMTDWPVTASVNSSTVTMTAKQKGPRSNDITYYSEIETSCGLTVTNTAAKLASGATADSFQTAADATTGTRYRYHVAPGNETTNIGYILTRIAATAAPAEGRRELLVVGCVDTPGNSITLATGRNDARAQVAWQEGSSWTPGEIAAAVAAVRAAEEAKDPAVNLDGVVVPGLPPRRLAADIATSTELIGALNAGVTPLVDVSGGKVAILRSITTRCLDASNNADYRVLDTVRVVVPDYVADDLAATWPGFVSTAGSKVGEDPAQGQLPIPGVVTPKMVRDFIYARLKEHEAGGRLSNVDANLPQLTVSLSSTVAGRIDAVIPVDVVDLLHQFGADVRQIG